MASATAIYGHPDQATYSASKFAVHGFTEGPDLEWSKPGIRVRDIWPTFVKTAMADGFGPIFSAKSLGTRLSPADRRDHMDLRNEQTPRPQDALDCRPAPRATAASGSYSCAGQIEPAPLPAPNSSAHLEDRPLDAQHLAVRGVDADALLPDILDLPV
ncbi:SDR family NAD(P)-dependent oxidoreductase [Pseudomonas sp.]|uniref:SDR family NAD(P)-dependent oxidoreductase n=1 Tax=Pseudomonas sp. TaxID=306 RepID=UPI0032C22551